MAIVALGMACTQTADNKNGVVETNVNQNLNANNAPANVGVVTNNNGNQNTSGVRPINGNANNSGTPKTGNDNH